MCQVELLCIDVSLCTAQIGGGLYIYSSSPKNRDCITESIFTGNTALAEVEESQGRIGGSAIFLTARKGRVKLCQFNDNEGLFSSANIFNKYEENDPNNLLILGTQTRIECKFIISCCLFEISEIQRCAIFCHKGKHGSLVELSDLTFKGNLAPRSHFIDGENYS